ncbi:MAG TPA: hypothetical protein VHO70_17020 [Chitinispirillaceae bacterium]|nr:hypothetical protein [Chitinispirillaceae bacterium]
MNRIINSSKPSTVQKAKSVTKPNVLCFVFQVRKSYLLIGGLFTFYLSLAIFSIRALCNSGSGPEMAYTIFGYPLKLITCIAGLITAIAGLITAITGFISVEYPASLLRGWKTSPVTVDDNIIY